MQLIISWTIPNRKFKIQDLQLQLPPKKNIQ